ncbi:hypothetical protein [Saccharopolyspora shandongensis]|uniref:hypothetical protein n=1 Tax=Saccharopolyspora shandongensis TaxID=418495 RepID=UPI00340B8A02
MPVAFYGDPGVVAQPTGRVEFVARLRGSCDPPHENVAVLVAADESQPASGRRLVAGEHDPGEVRGTRPAGRER